MKTQPRILIAIGGGYEGAVTAALLKSQGFDVTGLHLLWSPKAGEVSPFHSRCRTEPESAGGGQSTVRAVCAKLGIDYVPLEARPYFEEAVADYFVHEAFLRRMPSPCVRCNSRVKFRLLIEEADRRGIQGIATGHYAQVIQDQVSGHAFLRKAVDPAVDQSHLLFELDQRTLARLQMPLGGIPSTHLQRLARQLLGSENPPASAKAESCFVNDPRHVEFLEARIAPGFRPHGPFRTVAGAILGEHFGFHRHPLGSIVERLNDSQKKLRYVVTGFDAENSAVLVSAAALPTHTVIHADQASWVLPIDGLRLTSCSAWIKNGQPEVACQIIPYDNGALTVMLAEPQAGLVPGQPIVFYDGDTVMGGAWIHRVGN